MRNCLLLMAIGSLSLQQACDRPDPSRPPVDFARQVLPVLSENCFPCHGPDRSKVETSVEEARVIKRILA